MHLPAARRGEPVAHHVGDDRMRGPIGAAVFHDQSPVHQGITDRRRMQPADAVDVRAAPRGDTRRRPRPRG